MKQLGVGVLAMVLFATGLVASGAFASKNAVTGNAERGAATTSKAKATLVTVLTGKPIEYALKISRTAVRPGPVVFKVTNDGTLVYRFQICSTGGNADVCFGSETPMLNPGASAILTVNLKKGNHEYIGTAGGYVSMKGTLLADPSAAVGATGEVTTSEGSTTTSKSATSTSKGATTTTTTTGKGSTAPAPTTTGKTPTPAPGPTPAAPTGPTAPLVGDPTAGAAVFQSAGCGGCHTLKAANSAGTAGPNLDFVAPDQQTVITNVTFGNAMGMPAFSPAYSATQIANVAAYVYKSTH